jgi:cytoskeletal protein RodZ
MVDSEVADKVLIPERVGDHLRAARVTANMDLNDVATKTRIPLRHLQAIEAGDYDALPAPTYCVGFVKAYARAIGANEAEMASILRSELGTVPPIERQEYFSAEALDPERMPSRKLLWTTLGLIALVLAAYGVWRYMALTPTSGATEEVATDASDEASENASAAQPAPVNPQGVVTLTATDTVWLSIKDATGTSLIFREMKAGESFTIPANAASPKLTTGRPEKLKVTIDGKEVAPLGPPERTVKSLDVRPSQRPLRQPQQLLRRLRPNLDHFPLLRQ